VRLLFDVLKLAGFGMMVWGVAMIYEPAAWVVAGLVLVLLASSTGGTARRR